MALDLDASEKEAVRRALYTWYKQPQMLNWTINDDVVAVFLRMVLTMEKCGKTYQYVPSPVTYGNPLKQLSKQAIKKILKQVGSNPESYLPCVKGTMWQYRRYLENATNGLGYFE